MTKRVKLVLLLITLAVLLLIFFPRSQKPDSSAPRFVPAQSQPIGPFGSEYYEWDTDIPFRDGKTWIYTVLGRTNIHVYSYDLDNRQVAGELLKGYPVLENKNHDRILCDCGPSTSAALDKLFTLLGKISFGKIKAPTNLSYGYWFLDLKNNTARKAGQISEAPTITGAWHPSPGFRFGFHVSNKPSDRDHNFVLCDFDNNSLDTVSFSGTPEGWWDDRTILAQSPKDDFLLFDVLSRKVSPFITRDKILQQLKEIGIPAFTIRTFFNWNGTNYDVFFTGRREDPTIRDESFLVKVEKPNASLKPFVRRFQFEPMGRFNSNESLYIYFDSYPYDSDKTGFYLRDVAGKHDHILINDHSLKLPAFYGQSIIYHSNGSLWRTDLDGGNRTRVFAPAEQK